MLKKGGSRVWGEKVDSSLLQTLKGGKEKLTAATT